MRNFNLGVFFSRSDVRQLSGSIRRFSTGSTLSDAIMKVVKWPTVCPLINSPTRTPSSPPANRPPHAGPSPPVVCRGITETRPPSSRMPTTNTAAAVHPVSSVNNMILCAPVDICCSIWRLFCDSETEADFTNEYRKWNLF